jgi:hypothetical protein
MAGIIASSVSVVMTGGMTLADKAMSGYVTGEAVSLTTTPTGASYSWAIAKPSGATIRSDLSLATSSAPTFIPDVAGYYIITVTVDGATTYVIRLSVTAVAILTWAEAMRLQPKLAASVPAPATGSAVFHDLTRDRLVAKNSAGVVRELDPGANSGTFTLAGGTAPIANANAVAGSMLATMLVTAVASGKLSFAVTPGVGAVVTSDNGADASTYRYSWIG